MDPILTAGSIRQQRLRGGQHPLTQMTHDLASLKSVWHSAEEMTEVLSVSEMTMKRDWLAAREWLKSQVCPEVIR